MPRVIMSDSESAAARRLIDLALAEDARGGVDLTSQALIPASATGEIEIRARQAGVLCGVEIARMVFRQVDPALSLEPVAGDGDSASPGTVVARGSGSMRSLLLAERTALNFLTALSGVASLTRRYVDAAAGTRATILDTRKTIPGWRELQKFAVRCGGGANHRMGLFDAVLVKDNHLAWWGERGARPLSAVVPHLRGSVAPGIVIEIEVDSLGQLRELLPTQPDIILLDNMRPAELREAVALRDRLAPNVLLEASGGVNLLTVREIAETGVDRISVGALTHSAAALDIGFDWVG